MGVFPSDSTPVDFKIYRAMVMSSSNPDLTQRMDELKKEWRETISEHLKDLAESTMVTSEMTMSLYQNSLITHTEQDNLMNYAISGFDRAMTLYSSISKKWNDVQFERFKKVLAMSLNSRALEILNYKHNAPKLVCDKHRGSFSKNSSSNMEEAESGFEVDNQEGKNSQLLQLKMKNKLLEESLKDLKLHHYEMRKESKQMEKRLQELQKLIDEERMNKISLMNKVSSKMLSTRGVEQPGMWNLNSENTFQVHQTRGRWFVIEGFNFSSPFITDTGFTEVILSLSGNIIDFTQRHMNNVRVQRTIHSKYTADSQSPHQWTNLEGGFGWMWITTDYCNCAILMSTNAESISSSNFLYILSRKPTLPSQTLELLRDVAVELGFSKAHGFLIQRNISQTC